jgi:23S rRNA (pseudouridine1915-N3)-methyltransferase
MQITLLAISSRSRTAKSVPTAALTDDYVARAARLCPTTTAIFDAEAALLASTERQPGRPAALLVLFDSRGDQLTSEQFATLLARLRDDGTQRLAFAIGPPDGWSPAAHTRAHRSLALGRMTLPHELARAVVAEQIYRALTILAGHPYHSGH